MSILKGDRKMLTWKKLFYDQRIRDLEKTRVIKSIGIRNEFDRDFDRIIYSSSIRRLQDKTQVFPLQENDFTRTRLTHSMEVMALGESMAWSIANNINKQKKDEEFNSLEKMKRLPSMVKVACLVHDLGNPPFGHYGEAIIKNWFKTFFEHNKELEMSDEQKNDFINFDGNAQTIHILCSLQFLNDKFGVNFTLGSLSALMKYPWSSSDSKAKKGKFGYMQSEKVIFENIVNKIGVGNLGKRHPAALIMEAADDIAYGTVDMEDGIKKGIVPWSSYEEELNKKLKLILNDKDYKKYKDNIQRKNDLVRYQNFKINLQGALIKKSISNFMNNYEKIMEGSYTDDLYEDKVLKEILSDIEKYTIKHCFNDREVLKLELMGDKILSDLLDLFVPAVLSKNKNDKEKKLVSLISDNFKEVQVLKLENDVETDIDSLRDYEKIQLVVDYISGMTDSYASSLHKELKNGTM